MELVVKEVKKVKISANNINSFLVVSNAKLKRIRMDETNLFNKLQQQQKRKNKEKSIESKKDINGSKKTKKGIIGKTMSIWDKILNFFGIIGLGILIQTLPKVFENIKKFLKENEWLKQGIIFIFKTIAGAAMVMKNIYEFFAGKDLNKDKLAKQRREVNKNISVFERDVKLITNGVNEKLKSNQVDDEENIVENQNRGTLGWRSTADFLTFGLTDLDNMGGLFQSNNNTLTETDQNDIRKENELNDLLENNSMNKSNLTIEKYRDFISIVGHRDGKSTGNSRRVNVPGVGYVITGANWLKYNGEKVFGDKFYSTDGQQISRDEFYDTIAAVLRQNEKNTMFDLDNKADIKKISTQLGISIEKINEIYLSSPEGKEALFQLLDGNVMPGMMSDNNIIKDGSKSLSTLNAFKIFDESILSAQKDNKKILNNYNEMLLASTTLSSGIFTDQATAPTTGIQGEMYNYMTKELGLSHNKALGILANIQRESNFDIDAKGDPHAGGSFGLFQWNADAGRSQPMMEAVPDWETNWKGQIKYALGEDVGPEFMDKKFNSPQEAADWWMKYWERPADLKHGSEKHKNYLKQFSGDSSMLPMNFDSIAFNRDGLENEIDYFSEELIVMTGIKPVLINTITN